MRARACNAMSILPLLDLVNAAEAHGESIPAKEHARYAGPVRCELALEHEGAHCVKEWDDETGNLWWHWLPYRPGEFVSALACEALSGGADSQACYLIVDHPREHSWVLL